MRKRIAAAALACAVLLLAGCSFQTQKIRFGTADVGGTYYSFGTAFAEMTAGDEAAFTMDVKSTAGSAANLRLLSDGYLQLAIAQADTIQDAYNGTGTFADSKPYRGYSAVAALYTECCQVVVRADSDITSIDDLAGRTVSVGEAESGTEQNAEQILQAYGLSSVMLKQVNLNYSDAAKQLADGTIDAFFCTAGAPTTVISELSKQTDIRLLPIAGTEAQNLLSGYEFYTVCTIPAGTYTGQTENVSTLGVSAVLLASDKLSKDTVAVLTEALFENSESLQYSVPVDLQIDAQTAVEGVPIPFHSGAAAYYDTLGIAVDTEG